MYRDTNQERRDAESKALRGEAGEKDYKIWLGLGIIAICVIADLCFFMPKALVLMTAVLLSTAMLLLSQSIVDCAIIAIAKIAVANHSTRKRLLLGLCSIIILAILVSLSFFIEHTAIDILAASAMAGMFGVVCVLIWMHCAYVKPQDS